MTRLLMAYDADCGPCTRFRHFVHVIDLRGEVEFVSLIDADDSGLLDRIPESERHTAFHLIFADGTLLSGADAVPPLVGLLPGGRMLSKLITSAPLGRRLVSLVYSGFARGHNGSSCRYPRPVADSHFRRPIPDPVCPSIFQSSRSVCLLAGVIGGLVGSLAMGLVVHLPDALCVRLANAIAGRAPSSVPIAWGFHFLTAGLIGSAFGALASVASVPGPPSLRRSLLLGLSMGVVVWAGFFAPLMLTFLPRLVNAGLLASSFVAHVILGITLGLALAIAQRVASRVPPLAS